MEGNPPLEALNRALAPLGLKADVPLGFNNSYAIGMREELAAKLGVRTIADLARHGALRMAERGGEQRHAVDAELRPARLQAEEVVRDRRVVVGGAGLAELVERGVELGVRREEHGHVEDVERRIDRRQTGRGDGRSLKLADAHLAHDIGLVAGDAAAYSYLPDSVRSFPRPEALCRVLCDGDGTQVNFNAWVG